MRADRWLNLVGQPAFLRAVRSNEHGWRPAAALGLMIPGAFALGLVGYLVSGLINSWLVQVVVLRQPPTWPRDLISAARSGTADCQGCLLGGMTTTVMVAVISLSCMIAVLASAVLIYRRPAMSWITAAPRFRWRLFWAGLALFGLALGVVASIPEALHGWPDRPVFLKTDETVRMRMAYVLVMALSLPVAAAFEEVLCRGWLLQVTAAFTRSLPAILLGNSLVFALLHVDPDPGRNLSRAVLGMALSWGVLRTGGLELGIGIHAANNLIILVLAQTLQQSEPSAVSNPLAVAANVAVSLGAVVVIELVARWAPLRRWTGLDLEGAVLDGTQPPQPADHRANSTLAAP
ncbi:MAG: CPBP family intramembrane metalloprotease [Caulobacteraceae bacterium]|nr:CPBP family intramembrane metalloprotease [Caulobacteraceae bacterium]